VRQIEEACKRTVHCTQGITEESRWGQLEAKQKHTKVVQQLGLDTETAKANTPGFHSGLVDYEQIGQIFIAVTILCDDRVCILSTNSCPFGHCRNTNIDFTHLVYYQLQVGNTNPYASFFSARIVFWDRTNCCSHSDGWLIDFMVLSCNQPAAEGSVNTKSNIVGLGDNL
jgi:hypothetical protein